MDRVTRRQALQSAGLAVPVMALAACGGTAPASASPKPTAGGSASASSASGFHVSTPIFTKAERDRRWAAVRSTMGRAPWQFEALLVPAMSDQAYVQYLTQIGGRGGGAELIFPRDPNKPAVALTGSARNLAFWKQRLAQWADDKLMLSDKDGSKAVAAAMKELGLDKSGTRIGLAKLSASRFDPEGLVSYTYLENLKAALPGVTFHAIEQWGADAGPVDASAMVKSKEEQDVVRASVAAGEKAIQAIVSAARTAKVQGDIWWPAFAAMFQETGEDPTRLSIALDSASNSTLGAPTDDAVKEGQIITEEIDATVQGYRAQVNHAIFIGSPGTKGYDYYAAAMKVCVDALNDALKFIVPGKTTCGDLVDHYAETVARMNADDQSGVVLHSSGIGNLSRPRLGPSNSKEEAPIVLVPGMSFDFKPALSLKRSAAQDVGDKNRTVQLGEHVLVTDTGTVRLGKRELGPLTTAK
jgi:Xaa-Pro aminopeptidase